MRMWWGVGRVLWATQAPVRRRDDRDATAAQGSLPRLWGPATQSELGRERQRRGASVAQARPVRSPGAPTRRRIHLRLQAGPGENGPAGPSSGVGGGATPPQPRRPRRRSAPAPGSGALLAPMASVPPWSVSSFSMSSFSMSSFSMSSFTTRSRSSCCATAWSCCSLTNGSRVHPYR